jgi:hypothetical protein
VGVGFLVGKPEERGRLEDLGIDDTVILKKVLKNEMACTSLIWLTAATAEHDGLLNFTKCEEFLDWLRNYELLQKRAPFHETINVSLGA